MHIMQAQLAQNTQVSFDRDDCYSNLTSGTSILDFQIRQARLLFTDSTIQQCTKARHSFYWFLEKLKTPDFDPMSEKLIVKREIDAVVDLIRGEFVTP